MSVSEKNLYAYNALKSNRCTLNQQESLLHSCIIHLDNEIDIDKISIQDFASQLLGIITASEGFRRIDRVCIAMTHSLSSTLKIVSSANSFRLSENTMTGNYSCIVSGKSSLTKIKKTNMRVYSNIDDILSSYGDRNVQRSLKNLKKMGVKSGITIPLTASGMHSGLLFLNSSEQGAFDDLNDQDYSTLCLIKMVSNNVLHRSINNAPGVDHHLWEIMNDFKVSNIYSHEDFQRCMTKILQEKFNQSGAHRITTKVGDVKPLFNFLPLCYIISKALEASDYFRRNDVLSLEIGLEKNSDGHIFEFRINNFHMDPRKISHLQLMTILPGQNIRLNGDSLSILNQVDLALDGIDYSV